MKVHELQKAAPALQALSGVALPAKASYAVARNLNKLEQLLRPINKKHQELIIKYGANENGTTTVTPENMDAFMQEVGELSEREIDIAELHIIPLEMLGDAKIEPGMLAMLVGWMVVAASVNDPDLRTLHDET